MNTKEKPRGVPFQKGGDPRRHLLGRKSKDALSFKADMRKLIEERTDAEQIYNVLLRKAKAGVQWAVQELLDRGLGKAQQSHSLEIEHRQPLQVLYPGDPETDLIITAHDVKALPEAGTGNRAGGGSIASPGANGAVETGQDDPDDEDYIEACKKA